MADSDASLAAGWADGVNVDHTGLESRSQTILWAMGRLGYAWKDLSSLTLELVGIDSIEGRSAGAFKTCFAGIINHARAAGCALTLRMIGPNVPLEVEDVEEEECGLAITFHHKTYEEYVAEVRPKEPSWVDGGSSGAGAARVAFCFNAGIWGYPSWRPAVEVLLRESWRVPVVITAYSPVESDADEEVVDGIAADMAAATDSDAGTPGRLDGTDQSWYAWATVANPWASRVPRPSSVRDETLYSSQSCYALRWRRV